jgi:signal transduction histidine kinase
MGTSPADADKQLIQRVRHDLNNVLTAVLGQTQLLLREELSKTTKQRAKTIDQLAMRAADLVDQLRKAEHSE